MRCSFCALALLLAGSAFLPSSPATSATSAGTFALTPNFGPPGTIVTVSGSGWPAGDSVHIRWDAPFGQTVAIATASTAGTIGTQFVVAIVPSGPHDVFAVGLTGGTAGPMIFSVTGAQPTQPTQGTGPFPTVQPTSTIPQTCLSPVASFNPASVQPPGQTTFFAQGYAPGSLVALLLTGPGSAVQMTATANQSCQINAVIQVLVTDPPGSYTVQASGIGHNGQPLMLSAFFTVSSQIGVPPPIGPTATPTTSVVCALPSAFVSPTRLSTEIVGTFGGVGFRPGAMVQVDFEDAARLFRFPFFAPTEVGPATTTCGVSGTFTVNPTVPAGRYFLTLTGPNHLGAVVQARQEFEVGPPGQTPGVATVVIPPPPPGVPPAPPPAPGPPPPEVEIQELAQVAQSLAVDQTLTLVGGPPVPAVGQTNTYQHLARITNTSSRAQDVRGLQIANLESLLRAAAQQGFTVTLGTEYSPDTRVVSATASVGQASVRGSTVVWDGQLAGGQTVEIRSVLDHTPSTALALNQPIRGQTLAVTNPRGLSLSVPPPPLPQLPPAQRLVQPAPPPVDPTLGSRYFPDTGFTIANDDIWVFYHRRGGQRTFGSPISRQFTLLGSPVQLFERGMLRVGPEGGVAAANLLEDPFLPYDSLGDIRLPGASQGLIDSAPDPAAPDFGIQSQEFVRLNAAEDFDGHSTRFYTSFLSTVLFRDAFFDGRGDPNLVPGFSLEIWGLPTSPPGYQVIGTELVVGVDGVPRAMDIVDPSAVLLRFQRGVMRYSATERSTAAVAVGRYLRAVLTGQTDNAELVAVASSSSLWGQYNPEAVDWVDRPDQLPDTNMVLAFEPD